MFSSSKVTIVTEVLKNRVSRVDRALCIADFPRRGFNLLEAVGLRKGADSNIHEIYVCFVP